MSRKAFARPAQVVPALLALFSLMAGPIAQADEEPKVTVSGLLDLYYQTSFNHPPAGSLLFGRAFDVKSDTFSLGLAEVNVARAVSAKRPIGFMGSFVTGKVIEIDGGLEAGNLDLHLPDL